jgi:hypothetical protein
MDITGKISTHVLDLVRGRPASGIAVVLEVQTFGMWKLGCCSVHLDTRRTAEVDEDGRTPMSRNSLFPMMGIAALLLSGCVTVACDPDDPTFGKDCYECTRKAKIDDENGKNKDLTVKGLTEQCLRERGYTKQQKPPG